MSNSRRFRRRLVLVPELSEDQSPKVREGLARRRLVAIEGRCPCGAELVMPQLRPGTVNLVRVEHETDCPAVFDQNELIELIVNQKERTG